MELVENLRRCFERGIGVVHLRAALTRKGELGGCAV